MFLAGCVAERKPPFFDLFFGGCFGGCLVRNSVQSRAAQCNLLINYILFMTNALCNTLQQNAALCKSVKKTHNPLVGGSNPSGPTISSSSRLIALAEDGRSAGS
jgi:hypothetical protein